LRDTDYIKVEIGYKDAAPMLSKCWNILGHENII
jgi:hypothetical protein